MSTSHFEVEVEIDVKKNQIRIVLMVQGKSVAQPKGCATYHQLLK